MELNPCPFCGGEAAVRIRSNESRTFGRYMTMCIKCFCMTGEHKTIEGAANAWNRRAEK